MSRLIFRLRGVPDDERAEVQELLDEHQIAWYETDAGNWGIAMPGLWVKDDDDAERARELIDAHGLERAERLRAQYEEDKAAGRVPSLFDHFLAHPVRNLGILLFCAFVLYVMIKPFLAIALAE